MEFLEKVLSKANYKKIRFKLTKTNHLLVSASINGIKGKFILDTGASSTCVGLECVPLFGLNATRSETLAAGAGGTGMLTQLARKNRIKIGRWKNDDFNVVIFDLSHVNSALTEHKAKPVNGIIGADVLLNGKAIIDYYNHCLYLQQ